MLTNSVEAEHAVKFTHEIEWTKVTVIDHHPTYIKDTICKHGT